MADDVLDSSDGADAYAAALLRGRLVRLRAATEADLEPLAAMFADPASMVGQPQALVPRRPPEIVEQVRAWTRNDDGTAMFAVTALADGRLLGHAGMWGITRATRAATFGIGLDPAERGHGYGTDATRVVLRLAFLELNLHRVELSVLAANTRAVAAYRRAGFVEEGRARDAYFRAGRWHDELRMATLAPEWAATHDR